MTESTTIALHRNWTLFELTFAFATAAVWPYFLLTDDTVRPLWEYVAQGIVFLFLVEHIWASIRALWQGQCLAFTSDAFEVHRRNGKIVSIPFKEIESIGGKHRIWFGAEYGPADRIGIKLKPNSPRAVINECSPLYAMNPFKRWDYVTRFTYGEPVEQMLEQLKARGVRRQK